MFSVLCQKGKSSNLLIWEYLIILSKVLINLFSYFPVFLLEINFGVDVLKVFYCFNVYYKCYFIYCALLCFKSLSFNSLGWFYL